MGLEPQCARGDGRINTNPMPPGGFVTAMVDFAMMASTERDGELVADLATERR